MVDQKFISKLADIPLARQGFDALGMSAPVLVQMNPEGKWEKSAPENLEENRLKAVVQYLVDSRAIVAAQSYCTQCAIENQMKAGNAKSTYVPVVMMPIYAAEEYPFDIGCEVKKVKESKPRPDKSGKGQLSGNSEKEKDKDLEKKKKRGFVMQRLTDFDLMSQW